MLLTLFSWPLFFATIFTWLIYKTWIHYTGIIAKIPGYGDIPLVGNLFHMDRTPSGFYKQITELCTNKFRKYKICKLSFGTKYNFMIFTADQVEKLLTSYEYIDKSMDYEWTHHWLGLGLLTSGGSKWKSRRRMLTPSFHFSILKDALVTMNNHVTSLRDVLLHKAGSSEEPFNIFHHITLSTLDIIGETAMGVQMDALHHEDSDYVKAVYLVKDSISRRQRTPWLWPSVIYNLLPVGRAYNRAVDLLHKHSYKVIQERREARVGAEVTEGPRAFLDTLLDCKTENGQPLSDSDIREEVDTFMFEGHDTVSSALGFSIYLLGSHPEIQEKCQKELDSVIGTPRDITMEDMSQMTYLEWCIKEAMRIFAPVPFFARAIPKDIEIAGYMIPKDSGAINIISPALHRDPDVFPNPEKFDPTRFSPENSSKRSPYAYLPFSAGPRNCIGQRFAMMELKVILSMVLLNFDIHSTQTREELNLNPGMVLQPSDGIWVQLKHRAL